LFNFDKAYFEKVMYQHLDSNVNFILQVGKYIIDSGGKRIRPYLVLKFSKILKNKNEEKDYILAAALEYLHTASLLHDDVVDGSQLRRGKPTANRIFGNDTTVLTGDYMYANALYLFSIYGDIDMIKNVSQTVKKMAEGQLLELKKIADFDITLQEYYSILEGKTAALFGSCCYVGTALGTDNETLTQKAFEYGLNIGMAFQIVDDLLDYTGKEEKTGKSIMNDLREGKITYPLIAVREKLSVKEKEFIKSVLLNKNPDTEDLIKVKNTVESYGGIEKTKQKAEDFVNKAIESLRVFGNSKDVEELESLAKFIIEREV
jgi:octaprenyl-diphosphate synthase